MRPTTVGIECIIEETELSRPRMTVVPTAQILLLLALPH